MSVATAEHINSADGTSIGFWVSGDGPPMVLVHGAMSDHTTLARVVPLLEPHFTVCAIDRRGRGASGDGSGYAIEREFTDVAAVVDTLAERTGDRVFLYGHSCGATCALGAALLTSNVSRLGLYEAAFSGAFTYPPGWFDRLEALIADGAAEDAVVLALQQGAGASPTQIEVMRSLPSWPTRVAAAATLARELHIDEDFPFQAQQYAVMGTPTVLLVGEHSPAGQRAVDAAVHAALPNSEIAVLAGQEQLAQLVAPHLVAAELIRFMAAPSR